MKGKIPVGKGTMIWQIKSCSGGDVDKLAADLKAAGISWAAIKIVDAINPFNVVEGVDLAKKAKVALEKVGIAVYGWGYAYGILAAQEARQTVARFNALDLAGYMIDVESEYKLLANNTTAAAAYMKILRGGIDAPIGLCAYRFPTLHMELPWSTFLLNCDFHCPQVYWAGATNPGKQLTDSVKQLKDLKNLPVVPIGSAYHEHGWEPTVAQLDEFHATVLKLGLPAEGWWVWDYDHISGHPAWKAAIMAHKWPGSNTETQPPVDETDAEKLARLWKAHPELH